MFIPFAVSMFFLALVIYGDNRWSVGLILGCAALWFQPMACIVGIVLATIALIPYLFYREIRQDWNGVCERHSTTSKRVMAISLAVLCGLKK